MYMVKRKGLVNTLIFMSCIIFLFSSEYKISNSISKETQDIQKSTKRGTIYDRNKKQLAVSVSAYTIWVKPNEITSPKEIAKSLAKILNMDDEKILKKILNKEGEKVKITQLIEKEKIEAIKKEKLSGVIISEEYKRSYPFGNLADHVIGHTTDDNYGLTGVELRYEKILNGIENDKMKDLNGTSDFSNDMEKDYVSKDPLNITLTIDENIQRFTEKAIENALIKTKSTKVMAMVMDPKTGDILAMTVKSDIDPNTSIEEEKKKKFELLDIKEKQKIYNDIWRNPMISDAYEPGSTFKLITAAAGLEEGVVEPESPFCCKGDINVEGQKLRCWRYYKPHGSETFTQALQASCNPVFVEVGQRLGVEKMYEYIDAFGLIKPTGIDLPGETGAIVQNKKDVNPVELGTISFGQGISVTPMQLSAAISAIANDGKLMQPRIVKELVDDSGNVIHPYESKMIRQVISEKTAKELRLMMETVVTEGSGKKAYVPGYRVGGKTGTSQKVINGKYEDGKVYASFVGIAPIDDPQITVLVICDEPQGVHYAGLTATPAANEIIQDTLAYINVKKKSES